MGSQSRTWLSDWTELKYFNTRYFPLWMLKWSHLWPVGVFSTWFLSPFDIRFSNFNRFLDIWCNSMPQVHLCIPVPDLKSVKSLRSPEPFMASVYWLRFYSTVLGSNCALDSIFSFFLYFIKDTVFSEIEIIIDATEPLWSLSCSDKTQMVGHNNHNKI